MEGDIAVMMYRGRPAHGRRHSMSEQCPWGTAAHGWSTPEQGHPWGIVACRQPTTWKLPQLFIVTNSLLLWAGGKSYWSSSDLYASSCKWSMPEDGCETRSKDNAERPVVWLTWERVSKRSENSPWCHPTYWDCSWKNRDRIRWHGAESLSEMRAVS